jgi:peptidoglycan glycosyltransferase
VLFNDGGALCGGTVQQMLPESCDPGYALLGLALGAQDLTAEANAFGYNEIPPLDLPGVVASFFPAESDLAANPPFLAYSAIGQEDVSATALQNALVAAGFNPTQLSLQTYFLSMNYLAELLPVPPLDAEQLAANEMTTELLEA